MITWFDARREQMAVGSLSLALLMAALDASLTNTSLPALARAFDASFADAQWIVLAYLLAVTSLTVAAGRLGDVAGRRRVFLAAVALFTITSAICAVAPSLRWLVATRALQGACAAAMMGLSFALVGDIPGVRPERAMGQLAAMSAIGTTLGPAVGSVVWHFAPGTIFLVNLPFGCAAFALARRYVPRDTPCVRGPLSLDPRGTLLLAATLIVYALAMTRGGSWVPAKGLLLVAALAGAAVFALVESRTASPLVPVALFRDPLLSSSLATSALVATVVTATLIVGPFYLSRGLGLGHTAAGLALSMGPAAAALAASVAGRLVARIGASRAAAAGLTTMALGGALLALLPASAATPGYVLPLVVLTAGYATFQTANNTAALAAARLRRGVVAGLLTLSRNIGQITGASAMGAVFMHAAGTSQLAGASPAAIADGMRATLAVATVLVVSALILVVVVRTRVSPVPVTPPPFDPAERTSPC